MHFHAVLSSALLAATVVSAKTINIKVGADGLTFTPNSTTADVGDKVVFTFYPQDHNVVQASFAEPCKPLAGGFYSGFQKTSSGPAEKAFVLTINDTSPIWYYCGQAKHCESGMVGVINPASTGNKTLEAFAAAAKEVSKSENPTSEPGTGGVLEDVSSANSTSGSSSSTGSASGSTSTSTSTSMSAASSIVKSPIVAVVAAVAGAAAWIL
ncbi:hypothetical protein VTN96DRAFT_2615 [Rasamsonia emersonii]|uniref:Extracellular serine-rich protein n=1 Tax=Rasamsonia emersonii (strain ATCC 16479 / CBS 393.64 / IMI 116815) TaxID=1408163 RepID=A0A0F4YJV4_RASE3|nr:hypothetical protein T310_7546 [Rasamsonia emersonii CBS 393.64]KKA18509.1 hypothetical protein T310_7546 [Rasamsonia emersonii CBS 393.64]